MKNKVEKAIYLTFKTDQRFKDKVEFYATRAGFSLGSKDGGVSQYLRNAVGLIIEKEEREYHAELAKDNKRSEALAESEEVYSSVIGDINDVFASMGSKAVAGVENPEVAWDINKGEFVPSTVRSNRVINLADSKVRLTDEG